VGSLAAAGKKAPPAKSGTTDIDQKLEQARAAIAQRSGEQINWQVIASGGTEGTSENYQMNGTAGQTVVGYGESENYGLSHGFWQQTSGGGGGCCMAITTPLGRGNVDYDPGDAIDISDLVYLVDYMFTGGADPPCWDEADIDGSSGGISGPSDIDISDLVYLVDYMFSGGPPPTTCP